MDKYEGPSAHRPDDSGKSATESLDDDIIRHYLVGDLLEEEQQLEIEEAYLLDDDFFERVVAIRDDLLDDYRRGELSETELGRVRDMLDSSPALLDQLAFAEALERSLSSRRSPKPDSEHLPGRSLDRRLTISKLAGPRTPATVLLLL
ncbi:MAG TPA: hypothetical protein VEZ90_04265, partial [Blastocatellia bacterium]|nr:hypothetical protein [Blastocatellia bacterium]